MRKQLQAIFLVAALAVTAACSATPPSSAASAAPATPASVSQSGAQQITVTVANQVRFEPSSIVVRAGQPVELTLRNTGHMPHDFTLVEGVARPVQIKTKDGETSVGTFTIERPGTYTFFCSIPGHEAAGMKGTITAR